MAPSAPWMTHDLEWVAPHRFRRQYELRAGSDVVARLETSGILRRSVEVTASGVRWRLSTPGWLARGVRVEEDGALIASFERHWLGGGMLTLAGSTRGWEWRSRYWPRMAWRFLDEGQPVVSFRSRFRFLDARILVHVERDTMPEREVLLLVTVGFFLMLRAHRGHPH